MKKLLSQVFKASGVRASIKPDPNAPKFKVHDSHLTLEGVIKNHEYTMRIVDSTGRRIDSMSVSVNNENEIVNRVNESITTLKMLSAVYDKNKLHEDTEEDDEYEVTVDENAPADIVSGLESLYDTVMDAAEQAQDLDMVADDNDPEQLNQIVQFAAALYDCAIDITDYVNEITESDDEEDEVNESLNRRMKKKANVKQAIANLTVTETLLRGKPEYKEFVDAIKHIRSELTIRG